MILIVSMSSWKLSRNNVSFKMIINNLIILYVKSTDYILYKNNS